MGRIEWLPEITFYERLTLLTQRAKPYESTFAAVFIFRTDPSWVIFLLAGGYAVPCLGGDHGEER